MNFYQLLTVCGLIIVASAKAGFLNVAQNSVNTDGSAYNSGNGNNGGGGSSGVYLGYQRQVPLALTPGPISQTQSGQSHYAHASPFGSSAAAQGGISERQTHISGSAASSSSYRHHVISSVPATITTHGLVTSYVASPAHGYFGDNNGRGDNSPGNNGGSLSNTNNGANSNSGSSLLGDAGGYGYTLSMATGGNTHQSSAGRNEGNNNNNNNNGGLYYAAYGIDGNNRHQ